MIWHPFFGVEGYNVSLGRQPLIDARCPVTDCLFTEDEQLFNQSEIVLFDVQKMFDIPTYRFPHQRFVFYETESPANPTSLPYIIRPIRHNFFNWTMTYRLDSDIVHRYGEVNQLFRKSKTRSKLVKNTWHSKKKLVAWFVTRCYTAFRREEYVRQLSQFIPVDIYGPCGNLTCNQQNKSLCLEMLRADYKFYLAFENSLCPDYVTEKLFQTLMYDTVPVVLGGVDYDRFAPPHSFIDVRQFESAKQLADYLLLLDRSDHLYARYFDWKRH